MQCSLYQSFLTACFIVVTVIKPWLMHHNVSSHSYYDKIYLVF